MLGLSLESSLCKQSSHSPPSLSDSTPSASPSICLSCSLSPRFHTIEHAACSCHSLASETLNIFSCELCRFRQRHISICWTRAVLCTKHPLRIGSDKKRRNSPAAIAHIGLKVKAHIYILRCYIILLWTQSPCYYVSICHSQYFTGLIT